MKILSLITHPHVVSNLWDLLNTNYIFDEFRELSGPPIDSKDPNTITVQKTLLK